MSPDAPNAPFGRSIDDAMALLSVSRTTMKRLLSQGKLKAVKVGSKTLVTTESINAFWKSLPAATFRAPGQKAA